MEIQHNGKQAADASFTVKLVLKSNWKELLSKKETIECYESYGIGKTKGQDIVGLSASLSGATFFCSRKSELALPFLTFLLHSYAQIILKKWKE